MLKFNEILIVGDSFCGHRHVDWHWPYRIVNQLTGESGITRGSGFRGGSWWSCRKELLKEIHESPVKLLILCHTEPHRLPNDDDLGLNPSSVHRPAALFAPWAQQLYNQFPISDLQAAGRLYYKYLYSPKFHIWSQQQWFKELDDIIRDIPFIVHIPCFSDSIYPHATGIRCITALFNSRLVSDPNATGGVHIANHMTADENQQFTDILYNVIIDYMANPDRDREFIL